MISSSSSSSSSMMISLIIISCVVYVTQYNKCIVFVIVVCFVIWPRQRAADPRATSRKEPVRVDSFRFRTFRTFIGSVRFGKVDCPFRYGSACVFSDA